MHLLYLDDSGSAANPNEDYLVLGGFSMFEAQANYFTQELDNLASTIDPQNPHGLEFHASEIFSRRKHPWKNMSKEDAVGVIKAVLGVFRNSYDSARAFACVVHKGSFPGQDPMEMAFEDLCSRFNLCLNRLSQEGQRQRGLLILDKSAQETSLQRLSKEFRTVGTQWGVVGNLAETPLFVDSHASRAIQIADHISYAVFRRYNHHDATYFDIICSRFDQSDGVVHGLAHKQLNERNCMCPACLTRRRDTGLNR